MVHEDAEAAVSASAPELPAQRAPEVGEQQTLFELPEQAASVEDGAPDELVAGTGGLDANADAPSRFAALHEAWRESLV